jgi:hypothetical protein
MTLPIITMQLPAGSTIPSVVYLQDGTMVTPNASGQISIASSYVPAMIAGGWQVVIASGATHVP